MTPSAKSELEACIVRAGKIAADDQPRHVMVGVFIGSKGRAENLAILDSSGLELLDNLILRCLSRTSYIPAAPDKALIQWIFKTSVQRKHATPEMSKQARQALSVVRRPEGRQTSLRPSSG